MKHNAISFLIISLFLLLLAGCAGQQRRFVIGVSQCSDDEWRAQMNKEISREALFYPEAEVVFRTAKDNKRAADTRHRTDDTQPGGLAGGFAQRGGGVGTRYREGIRAGHPGDSDRPQDSFGQLYGLHRCRQLRHRAQRGRIYRANISPRACKGKARW